MSSPAPQVSIIIVNYNTPDLTSALIESIVEVTVGIVYQIVVIDNNSLADRKYSAQASSPEIKVFHFNRNLGFGRAVNWASRQCYAPHLLLANSDCRLYSNIIPEMVACLQTDPEAAACAPRLVFPDGRSHSSIRHFPNYRNIYSSRGSVLSSMAENSYTMEADRTRKRVAAMSATFMLVRRDLFEQVGRFDERYFMYVEDTDLCRKFADLEKHVVYLGDLEVHHRWGGSTRLTPVRMKVEHHKSIRTYFCKHFPDLRWRNIILSLQLAINLILVSAEIVFLRRKR